MSAAGMDQTPDAGPAAPVMQCMEIWGGNRAIASGVSMAGLDVSVYSRPFAGGDAGPAGSAGGGDIHYLSSCATGRISRMIVADVSGHGGEVAPIAANLRRLMGKYSNYIDQTRFVDAVNRRFNELRDEGERYSGLFATAVVATYFAPTDQLSICNAGHPSPLRYDAARRSWEPVRVEAGRAPGPANLPLGVLDEVNFDQRTLTLGEHDLLLICTDALLEVPDPLGRQLGEAGLMRVLSGIDAAAPERFLQTLRDRLAAFATGASAGGSEYEFGDDVTMLLLRRNAQKPRPSPALGAAAGIRIALNAARSIVRGERSVSLPQLRVDSILGAMIDRFNRPSRRS